MDGFFGIGIQELILIAIVALIVLGPERLPATFREIAKFIRQVRNLTRDFTQQFGDDFKALEDLNPRRLLQQAIESIDEEEQAKESTTKGKATTSKTTTPAKTTPAKSSTGSTTGTSTAKSTMTKSTTTSSTTTTAKTVPQPASKTVASTAKETANTTPPTEAPAAESAESAPKTAAEGADVAVTSTDAGMTPLPAGESENRIAPPAIAKSLEPSTETDRNPVIHSASSNGVSSEGQNTMSSEAATAATVTTNGTQDHSSNQ